MRIQTWPFTIWEIVSNDVDTLTALYERMHDLSFAPLALVIEGDVQHGLWQR